MFFVICDSHSLHRTDARLKTDGRDKETLRVCKKVAVKPPRLAGPRHLVRPDIQSIGLLAASLIFNQSGSLQSEGFPSAILAGDRS